MKRWKCSVCGYIHEGEEPPETCPLCGVSAEKFVEMKSIKGEATSIDSSKESGRWKCTVCGYIHEGEGLPEKCPLCGVGIDKFERLKDGENSNNDLAEPADENTAWKCTVCGYIHNGTEPPEKCPLCGVGAEKFVRVDSIEEEKKAEIGSEGAPSEPGKKTILDFIRLQILKHHIHPISVHFPNGILPAALVFMAVAAFFTVSGLELAAFFNLIFVLINMPLVMISGYLEWQSRYNGALTLLFKAKIAASLTVIVCLTWLVGWRIINPEIIYEPGSARWVYLGIAVLMVTAAGVAGHLGGKLVFGGRD